MDKFPEQDETFLLIGPAGLLEVAVSPANEDKKATAIICHPHPLHGGTMNNKVVTTLARTFKELGLNTVRFNFRGVGKSEGVFAEGVGEVDDLRAVIKWVQQVKPNEALWLGGFSFGGFIAGTMATQMPIAQLVTIAPQVSRFIEANTPPITVPWVLVQGEQDEVVSAAETFAWYDTLNPKPILIKMPDAGHFFHGKLVELRERLKEVLNNKLN